MNQKKAILSLDNVSLSLGSQEILKNQSIHVYERAKICLVGKNGCGKSTFMNLLRGKMEPDEGKIWQHPASKIAYLPQNYMNFGAETLLDHMLSERGHLGTLSPHEAEAALEMVGLSEEMPLNTLSGGQRKRADLAYVLSSKPDVLLMDEPTNHLDVEMIEWLEGYLSSYNGAVLVISHDRRFLEAVSKEVFWMQNGQIRRSPKGFKYFEEWREKYQSEKEKEISRLEKKIELETNRRITARRKQNRLRLENKEEMTKDLQAKKGTAQVEAHCIRNLQIEGEPSSKRQLKFTKVFYGYNETALLENVSFDLNKGQKVGIIGPNGTGKTTLLKLILDKIQPQSGLIHRSASLKIALYDQMRSALDPHGTIKSVLCANGGDTVEVGGRRMNITTYLKMFFRDVNILNQPISSLSGGEASRVLLAKTLSTSCNLMILDEPTNDLDLESIRSLERILSEAGCSIILISHDRALLDAVVDRTLVLQNKTVTICAGGYSDALSQLKFFQKKKPSPGVGKSKIEPAQRTEKSKNFSYKHKYELQNLPKKIQKLEGHLESLNGLLSDENLYQKDPKKFDKVSQDFEVAKNLLSKLESRWLELEVRREEAGEEL